MKLWDVITKDLRIVLRDRLALIFIFLMPIVLIVILSFALGGVFSDEGVSIAQIHIAVVDETAPDEGEAAAALAAQTGVPFDTDAMSLYNVLDADGVKDILSYQVTDAETAQSLLESEEVSAVVTIPQGYMRGLVQAMMGGGGDVQIKVTGSSAHTLESGIVNSIVTSYADTLSSLSADIDLLTQTLAQNGALSAQTMEKIDIGAFVQQTAESSGNLTVDSKGVAARKVLNSFSYYSIAITCMFVLYSAGQGSVFLHTESEEKTLQRLMAAGISRARLLFGKSVAVFFLCILQLVVLLGFSTLVFGIDWGNPFAFLAISVCVAVSVTGLGVLLMVLVYRAGNPSIGNVFQSILVQVFALIGGSFLPLSILPSFFSTAALFTPNGLAIMAYSGNVTGAPFSEIMPYLLGSLALGVVLYGLGIALFPRERRA